MLRVEAAVRPQELDVQVAGDRQVQHHVDGVLALFLGDPAQRLADVGFQFVMAAGGLHDQLGDRAAHAGLDDLQLAVGFFGLVFDGLAQGRIPHLRQLVARAAGRQFAPRRARVVQVPVFEREREAGAMGAGLAVDRQVRGAAAFQPVEAAAVHLGIFAGGHDDVVQDGPPCGAGQFFEKGQVGLDVAGRLRDLDEALVTHAQHVGQIQDVLVGHDVGHHGRAVVIGLGRVGAEPLDREAAQPGVHALVQQALHLLPFRGRGGARLGRVEPHDVRHERGGRHVLDAVHALGRPVQRVEIFRDRLPVPFHAGFHGIVGNGFGAGHGQHRAFAERGFDRREPETAIAQHDRGHAVPAGDGAPRVPADLGVVMRMQIDEPGCDDQPVGIDDRIGTAGRTPADPGDFSVLDPDVALKTRNARSVDDGASLDMNVERRHAVPP